MIRRALSSIIIVALLAAWGWSAWQVQQLRVQVRALQSENRAVHAQNKRLAHGQEPRAEDVSWLARADAHIQKAGDALSRGDVGRTQRELSAGANDMGRAVRAPAAQAGATLARTHAQITQLDQRLTALQARMQDLSARTAPQIGLLRAQAGKIQAQAHALWRAGRD